jgi:GT2 family glycosyltransferase
MKTLIATLNYKQPEMIYNLAHSLLKHLQNDNWHWMIRDNTPDDSVVEKLLPFMEHGKITIVRKPNEGTFASQHNDLMKEGLFDGYANLLMLNNDTLCLNDFLSPMVVNLRDQKVGCVGANLYYADKSLQHCGIAISEIKTPFNINNNSARALNLWPTVNRTKRKYVAVTGACLLMRMEDYKSIGGMRNEYPWCFDDVELCFRMLKEHGKISITEPQAQLMHFENTTTLKNPTELKPSYPQALKLLQRDHKDMLESNWEVYKMDANIYE